MPLGGIGYKSNIDPSTDLTNYIIDSAIIMHAVKVRLEGPSKRDDILMESGRSKRKCTVQKTKNGRKCPNFHFSPKVPEKFLPRDFMKSRTTQNDGFLCIRLL